MKELELYIHIPFCLRKCLYCDFLSFPGQDQERKAYLQALQKEIAYYGPKMKDRKVVTLFIGGGTPSLLEPEEISNLMGQITSAFQLDDQAEITIECNPGTLNMDKLEAYLACGINRISLGCQSTNNKELKLLGRIHTYEEFLESYGMVRKVGFDNVNVDIMSGLPYQKPVDFVKTLQQVMALKPDHISAYSLILEKGTPFYETYKFDQVKQEAGLATEFLPSEDQVYRMTKLTQQLLEEKGYRRYEISNFAREGKECRHNIGYWTRADYLGLGLGAASLLDNVRYSNGRDLAAYLDGTEKIEEIAQAEKIQGQWFGTNLHASAEPVSRRNQMEEFFFLGLRLTRGVTRADFTQTFGVSMDSLYQKPIAELKKDGLLISQCGQIYLSDRGMDLANYCMAKFLD